MNGPTIGDEGAGGRARGDNCAALRPALVACDLDGTLVDEAGTPLPGVAIAVAELVGAGVQVR